MTRLRIDRLRRLVRVTDLLYRKESAELTGMLAERAERQASAFDAVGHLDQADPRLYLLAGLGLTHAARLRREVAAIDARLARQIAGTGAALASVRGAESRLEGERTERERTTEKQALAEVYETAVRRGAARFG